MPQNEADFENELEQALAAYADPEDAGAPRLLTGRVLAAVESKRRQQRRWWAFATALPVAVCLMMAVFLQPWKQGVHQPQISPQVTVQQPAIATICPVPVPQLATIPLARVHKRESGGTIRHNSAKLARFPNPSPLSEQERLLLTFATTVPPKEQESILKSRQQVNEPIHVSQLAIAPIDIQPISSEP